MYVLRPHDISNLLNSQVTVADIIETNFTKPEEQTDEKHSNDTKVTQNPDSSILQTERSNDVDNEGNNGTVINNTSFQNSNEEKEIKTNEIIKNDTLLKFVYKKGENINEKKKTKGHIKNSLRRRKRSSDPSDPLPRRFQKPALIVNYETSHAPSATANWSPPISTANLVKNQRLADFNIGTNHNYVDDKKDSRSNGDSSEIENLRESSNESNERGKYKQNESEERYESGESEERKDYKKSQKYSTRNQNSAESNESDSLKNGPTYLLTTGITKDDSKSYNKEKPNFKSAESKETAESSEEQRYKSTEGPYVESPDIKESSRYRKPYTPQDSIEQSKVNSRASSAEPTFSSENSNENSPENFSRNNKKYNRKYNDHSEQHKQNYQRQSPDISIENSSEISKEKYDQSSQSYESQNKKQNYHNKNQGSSIEISSDGSEKESYLPQNANQLNNLANPGHVNKNSSSPIQDVDLGKLSHERIKIDKNGKVEPANDRHDNTDPNSAVEILSPNLIKPNIQNRDVLQLVTSIHTPLKEYADKLIQINDGEVRPVVEIHTEQNDESNEETNKDNSSSSESLESLLSNKEPQHTLGNDQNGKIVTQKEADTGNVKQQFERIPLNYNHDKNSEKTDNENKEEDASKVDNLATEKEDVTKSDGTLDTFAPENVRHDENLNIKFDDLHINLPEIKLPDDILDFTKKHSPFHDENDFVENKKSRYQYGRDEDKPHVRTNKKTDNDDKNEEERQDALVYYGYYDGESRQKQDYRKKNDEDKDDKEDEGDEEGEDLYEKFVRERFGKRGTFEKRSEKLEDRPLNPHLTKRIQNILKKTADIDEQAKKSGDPNAGYMWTLEYGENL